MPDGRSAARRLPRPARAPRPVRPARPGRVPRAAARLLALLLALVMGAVVAACGSGGGGSGGAAETGDGPAQVAEGTPQRIVSLSPSATETLYAVGAGGQVVAVDDQSDYPPGVPTTDLSGYTPNVEAILSYNPDLVVFATDPGDLASSLDKVGVRYIHLPAPETIEGAYEQFEQIGVVSGHVDEARALEDEVRGEITDAISEAGDAGKGLKYYHELDKNLFTVTSTSFIGQVYALFGLDNIADAAGAAGQYPQLQSEYIVSADPDLIFLADAQRGGATPQSVAERPGWSGISAVRDGRVYVLNDDITSRWGPRIGELAGRIADLLAGAQDDPTRTTDGSTPALQPTP